MLRGLTLQTGAIHEGLKLGKGGRNILEDYQFHLYVSGGSRIGAIKIELPLYARQVRT